MPVCFVGRTYWTLLWGVLSLSPFLLGKTMLKDMTTKEELINLLLKKHTPKEYDYSEFIFINMDTETTFKHRTLGEFKMTPNRHLFFGHPDRKHNQKGLDVVMNQGNLKFNNLYTIPPQSYRETRDKIWIQCPEHGLFSKVASIYTNGQGCPTCSALARKKPLNTIITEGTELYKGVYDYSLLPAHPSTHDKVKIKCLVHDHTFEQVIYDHLDGHVGCVHCIEDRKPKKEENILGRYIRTVTLNSVSLQLYDVQGKIYLLSREAVAVIGHKQISHVFRLIPETEKARHAIDINKSHPYTTLITPLGLAQAIYTTRKIHIEDKEAFLQTLLAVLPCVDLTDVRAFIHKVKGIKHIVNLQGQPVEVYIFDKRLYILLSSVKTWLGYGLRTEKGYVSNFLKKEISKENTRVEYGSTVSGSYLTIYVTIDGLVEALARTTRLNIATKHKYYKELKEQYVFELVPPLEDKLLDGDKTAGTLTILGTTIRYVNSSIGKVISSKEAIKVLKLTRELNYHDKQDGEYIKLQTTSNGNVGAQLFITPLIFAQKVQHSRKFPATKKQEILTILSNEFDTPFDFVCRTFKETDFVWDLKVRIQQVNKLFNTNYKLQLQYPVLSYKLDALLTLNERHIIIEFDEKYHKGQQDKDEKRMKIITTYLEETNTGIYDILRVPEEQGEELKEWIMSLVYKEIFTNNT